MQRKQMIIGGVIALVIVFILVLVFIGKGNKKNVQKQSGLETHEVLPTVDPSVKVELSYADSTKDYIELSVSALPSGTKSVEYQLNYETAGQGQQGAESTDPVSVDGQSTFTKKIQLATCSSGTCVHHALVSPVTVLLKFNGTYGARSFEKDYVLEK